MGAKWQVKNPRAKRLPKDWRYIRARVLRNHRYICHLCGEPGATEVDHVQPGDNHHPDNLRPAHQHCHSIKSHKEKADAAGAASAARAAARYRQPERHPGLP